jgi:hypothetical protein
MATWRLNRMNLPRQREQNSRWHPYNGNQSKPSHTLGSTFTNISGLVCAISSRLWGLPPRIGNSFFIFFHNGLTPMSRRDIQSEARPSPITPATQPARRPAPPF